MFLPNVEEKIHPAPNRAGRTMCNPQREMNAAGVNNKSTNGSFISTPSASMILPHLHVHNPPHKTVVWTAHGPWTKAAVGFLIGWLTCHRTNLCHESCQPPCTCRVVLHTQRTRCCETKRNCAVCALGSYSVPNHATGRVVPPWQKQNFSNCAVCASLCSSLQLHDYLHFCLCEVLASYGERDSSTDFNADPEPAFPSSLTAPAASLSFLQGPRWEPCCKADVLTPFAIHHYIACVLLNSSLSWSALWKVRR